MNLKIVTLSSLVAVFAIGGQPVFAAAEPGLFSSPVNQLGGIWDLAGNKISDFSVSDGSPTPTFAAADFGHDGISELLVGAGVGERPTVRVLRIDGSIITSFSAFPTTMVRGVAATPADVNGDGQAEIVVATGPRAVAEVRVEDLSGAVVVGTKPFFPYGAAFTGGLSVAAGDLNQDGSAEILTAPLTNSPADVVVWHADSTKVGSFRAFPAAFRGGARLAVGNVLGDQNPEIIAVPATGGNLVRIFDGKTFQLLKEFVAIDKNFGGGLQLAIGDVGSDGLHQIIVTPAGSGGPHIFTYSGDGTNLNTFFVGDTSYRGGVLLGFGTFVSGQSPHLATLLAQPTGIQPELSKLITVDLSEQRLRAYENGVLIRTFLISSGRAPLVSPTGTFPILAKPYNVWYRGPGYDLGIVPFNMRFLPGYYLHYAPWHNNFGATMSHGCINIDRTNAEWIYNWSEVGVPVQIVG